jgi:hypothetical protein
LSTAKPPTALEIAAVVALVMPLIQGFLAKISKAAA